MARLMMKFVCILVSLSIISAGSPPTMLGNKDRLYIVKAGDSVKLRCRASGADDINLGQRTLFFWTKTNGDHRGIIKPQKYPRFEIRQGKYLRINNVQPDDEGVYLCTARNADGIDSVKRTLQVVGLPVHKADHTTEVVSAKPPALKIPFSLGDVESSPLVIKPRTLKNTKSYSIGDDMRLKCVVKADPKATLQWLYNGNIIKVDNRVHLAHDNSSLRINVLRMTDAGNYTCMASNKLGQVQVDFCVTVETSIDLSKTFNSIAYLNYNLTLVCKVQLQKRKSSLPRIQWRRKLIGTEFEDRFISPVEDDMPTERKRKRDSGFSPIEKERWRFNMLTNRTLVSRFTISSNVTYADAGMYTCYVGKPSNWRRVHTIIIDVHKGSLMPGGGRPSPIDEDVFPFYVLVGFPIFAGLLCLAVVFLCWRHSKKTIRHQPAIRSKVIRSENKGRHVHLSICAQKCKSCQSPQRTHSDIEVST